MCGDSSRVSQGGLLAVIHPVPNSSSTIPRPSLRSCRLHLYTHGSNGTVSQLQYDIDAEATDAHGQRLEVRIHQFGELSHSPSLRQDRVEDPSRPSNPIMHNFYINQTGSAHASLGHSVMTATVLQGFNLGVGGTGVVGRAVSILDEEQVVVGEGIIGWN